jgi:hypothetical protein
MIGRADYEERREARIDHMEAMQSRNEAEAHAAYTRSHDILDPIPFGQPNINGRLTGTLNRARNAMEKSVDLSHKAAYYAGKAESARNNKAISADDPQAIEKLEAKIAALEKQREKIKAFNREARKNGTEPAAWYELPYISKDIKRLKDRIESLKKVDAMKDEEIKFFGGRIVSDSEENRVMIYHDEKPGPETIQKLKCYGFRWSPKNHAWQRQRTPESMEIAKRICNTFHAAGGSADQ